MPGCQNVTSQLILDNWRDFTGCSKWLSSKAAASEEARRYEPHFVWPFTSRMDLGERISPDSVSDLREVCLNVEPLSEARTKLADIFSILLPEGEKPRP
jgi:hypothetical protein